MSDVDGYAHMVFSFTLTFIDLPGQNHLRSSRGIISAWSFENLRVLTCQTSSARCRNTACIGIHMWVLDRYCTHPLTLGLTENLLCLRIYCSVTNVNKLTYILTHPLLNAWHRHITQLSVCHYMYKYRGQQSLKFN